MKFTLSRKKLLCPCKIWNGQNMECAEHEMCRSWNVQKAVGSFSNSFKIAFKTEAKMQSAKKDFIVQIWVFKVQLMNKVRLEPCLIYFF